MGQTQAAYANFSVMFVFFFSLIFFFCCRPVGQMLAAYASYSGDLGLITPEQDVVLLLVFSEPVNGLKASSFSISGPSGATVSGLRLLRGTNTYYHFTVNLPGNYYDAVTVNLQV